ncbi:MAG: D-alanyl-D-alanine carboxypeptidase, partial [Clostridia bacterium]|nr:D-alanyl-D-alanine carboxypeptidase [Clostridia bacterium]
TSGSVENFATKMNQTAVKAGAKNSNFVNPHGLHDKEHYSTAADLAKITAYAMKCKIFAEIVKTKTHKAVKLTPTGEESVTFYNKNKLLYSYPYATGVKTGYTTHSGRCLVSAAEKDGRKLVCVVLNVYDTYGVTKGLFDRYFCKKAQDRAEIS